MGCSAAGGGSERGASADGVASVVLNFPLPGRSAGTRAAPRRAARGRPAHRAQPLRRDVERPAPPGPALARAHLGAGDHLEHRGPAQRRGLAVPDGRPRPAPRRRRRRDRAHRRQRRGGRRLLPRRRPRGDAQPQRPEPLRRLRVLSQHAGGRGGPSALRGDGARRALRRAPGTAPAARPVGPRRRHRVDRMLRTRGPRRQPPGPAARGARQPRRGGPDRLPLLSGPHPRRLRRARRPSGPVHPAAHRRVLLAARPAAQGEQGEPGQPAHAGGPAPRPRSTALGRRSPTSSGWTRSTRCAGAWPS